MTDADVKAEVNDANANATVAVANNVVTVTVTAQDGTTVKVYRVVLAKKAVTPDPEGPTDPDSGKDDGDKNTGKDPDKGDKPGADLSETGAAVLGLGGAVGRHLPHYLAQALRLSGFKCSLSVGFWRTERKHLVSP